MRGSKRQRALGVLELRVYPGADPVTGKRRYVSRTFRGKAREAETCLAALVSEVSRGSHRGTVTTLGELVERYLDRFRGSPTTLASYRSIVRCHLRAPIGQRPPLADVALRKLDAAGTHAR